MDGRIIFGTFDSTHLESGLELDGPSGAETFIGCGDDAHGGDGVC